MAAIRIYRRLQDQRDVDPNGLPEGGAPVWHSTASKFVVETVGGGAGFSAGVSDIGTTLGDTGVTGTRLVLAGIGRITLSQSTDAAGGTVTISGGTVAAGAFSAGVSTDGNTAGDTGLTGTQIILAGGNNITLSQSNDGNGGTITVVGPTTVAQSVQTQNLFDLTISGNTDGAPALVSSGTLTLAGGNNITLSQVGNAISIIGASAASETQVAISGIAASDTTYSSGTVRFTGVGGGVTVSSNTGQRVDISVAAPVAQTGTQFSAGISGGNTSGQTGTVAGRLVLAGGNRITLSGSTNGASATVTISAPNAQTGISSIVASDATYTSGSVQFTGSNMITVRSSANQRVVIDATQSVQTQNVVDVTMSGNTAGAGALVSSGTLTLAGGNNITLSQAGNAITISGPNVGGAQTGISGLANSQTTFTSGTVSLSELGAITIRSTTGNQFQFSVNPQSVQPETQTFVGGIAASDTTYTSGTVRFTGVGGGITVSSNTGQRVDLSVAAPINFSGGISGGNTSGDTGATGTRLVFAGGNNVTLSGATDAQGGTITISGANIGGAQTGISGLANSETTFTSGTVSLSELGAITIRSTTGNQFQLSVNAQTDQTLGMFALGNTTGQSSSTTRDARSLSVRGDGIVSVGYSNGSLRISASQSVQAETQTAISGIANSQTTYTSGTVSLSELGAITIRSTTGNQFQFSVAAQTAESQSIGMSNIGNTSGTTGIASGAQVRFLFAGGNSITLSQSLNGASGTITISGPSISESIGMSNIGNTSGTTGVASGPQVRFVFAGGNNITLSQSLNGASGTITVSGPNTAAQTNQTLGMYALSQTTGQSSSTTMDARTISINADGIITAGFSAGSLRISATTSQSVQTQNVHNVTLSGNTAGVMAQISSGTMTLAGGNNITVSQNGNAVTISGPNVGGAQTGISGIIASDATYTSGTVEFTGSNMVTVKSSAGQRVVIDATQSVQSVGLFALGNTTGESSSTTRDARSLSIRGDGIVSVGYSNGSLRISASQSVQPETQTFLGGLVASDKTYTSGTITITGVGGGITVNSNAGQRIDLSVAAPVAQTDQTVGLYAVQNTTGQSSSTTRDARSLSFAGDGAVSVGFSAGSLRISAPVQTGTQFSAGLTNAGNTAGDTGTVAGRVVLVGSNNITLSGSTNGASQTISILGGAGGAAFSAGISGGNTSGDTGITGTRLVFAGGNSITLSGATDANGGSITVSAPNASVLSAVAPLSTSTNGSTISILGPAQLSVGFSTQGNTSGNTGFVTGRMALVGSNGITLSGSTNAGSQTITISGITQSVESQSIGMSNIGNTSGTTGIASGGQVRFVFAGGNNITLSQSLNGDSGTITISAPNLGAGAMSAGVSNLGNSAGATGITGTQLVFVGSDNITLSQTTGANGGTVSIIGGAGGGFSAGVSTGGNTAGATGVTGTRLVLVGTNPISLSQTTGAAGATVSIDAPATSSLVGTNGISVSTNGSTISVMPETRTFFAPYDEAAMVTGQQGQQTIHVMPMYMPNLQFDRILLGVQISNASNSSFSITLTNYVGIYTKNASTISLVSSTSTSYNFSGSGTAGSYSLYGGPRQLSIPWTVTLTASDYYVAINMRSTTGGGAGHSISQLLQSKFTNSDWSGLLGAATNASAQRLLGQGHYSVTSAGLPNSMAFSDIRGTGSIVQPSPDFHFRSGTV